VLLPVLALLRRVDLAEVIGRALERKAAGWGHRRIAAEAGVPPTTARGWVRRFERKAEAIRAHFTALAYRLDPALGPISPQSRPLADAVEAVGMAAQAAGERFGLMPSWVFASGASGARLLCNTNSPFPALA
jgi:transposase-like protein